MVSVRNSRARIAIRFSKLSWLLLKIELCNKFHAEVATYASPSYIIKNSIYLEYYIIIIATQLLQIATQFTI